MILHAGELGVTLDTGNNRPDCKLQYRTQQGWQDYMEDGELKLGPVDIASLEPGEYRHVPLDTES